MAFRLTADVEGASLLDCAPLNCFDTLGDAGFADDRAGMLAERSALELVRDQLDAAQLAELDRVDAFWRANPEAFNADFAMDHAFLDKGAVLAGLIKDTRGKTPDVPRSHWWWRPLETA